MDPYNDPPWIPPFHIPAEKRVPEKAQVSRFVCNMHGFVVDQCCEKAVVIKKAEP